MFALALGASPVLASAAARLSGLPIPGGALLHCGDNTYTITGTYSLVMHLTSDFTGHETFTGGDVVATITTDDGFVHSYPVVGAETHGATYNARTDAYRGLDTFKYRIVGTGDSVNIVTHSQGGFAAGVTWYDVDHGTCDKPEWS